MSGRKRSAPDKPVSSGIKWFDPLLENMKDFDAAMDNMIPPPKELECEVEKPDTTAPGPARVRFEPVSKRPVTMVPDIQEQFQRDPVDAIRKNAGFHLEFDAFNRLVGPVTEIAEARKQQSDVADALWQNEDFHLIKLVQGICRDTTLMNRELNVSTAYNALSLAGGTPANPPAAGSGGVGGGGVGGGVGGGGGGVGVGVSQAAKDRLVLLENIAAMMEQPQVSGEIQMSAVMLAAVEQALMHLAIRSPGKFSTAQRYHFYKDIKVKTMFAKLIATIILEGKIDTPNQYYKVDDRRSDNTAIGRALSHLETRCVWTERLCAFTFPTPSQIAAAQIAKNQGILDIYSIAG